MWLGDIDGIDPVRHDVAGGICEWHADGFGWNNAAGMVLIIKLTAIRIR